jgi:hypothetical protein
MYFEATVMGRVVKLQQQVELFEIFGSKRHALFPLLIFGHHGPAAPITQDPNVPELKPLHNALLICQRTAGPALWYQHCATSTAAPAL